MSIERRKPVLRKTPLPRGTKAIARTGRPKRVNATRKASEWVRAYHSKAFVRFTKSAPCAADGRTPCDAAHSEGGGAGRKADWTTVIPLCSGLNGCHARQHRQGWASIGMTAEGRRRAAKAHHEAFLSRHECWGSDDDAP